MEAALTRDLSVAWLRRPDGRSREIAGIPQDLLDNDPGEPITYPILGIRGLTESEAQQMMADGLMSAQAENRVWTVTTCYGISPGASQRTPSPAAPPCTR